MIVTPAEMRAIEETAFAAGASPESLMDAVGEQLACRLLALASSERAGVLFYAGRGNNAGDALVAAARFHEKISRLALDENRYRIALRLVAEESALGALPQNKFAALPPALRRLHTQEEVEAFCRGRRPAERLLVVDGLLGLGAHGPLREPIRAAAREINALRARYDARVVAIDVPSGVDPETGEPAEGAVVADETFAVGFVKTGLLADAATNHVGRLSVLDLPEFAQAAASAGEVRNTGGQRGALTTRATLAGLLPQRAFDTHKGQCGHVAILAGSVGATGAAVMCSHAAVRAGAGLVTLFVTREVYPIVAASAAAEVMVQPLASPLELLKADARKKYDVLAVGPGLGRAGDAAIRKLIEQWPGPMVVDADGLNALAGGRTLGALDRAAGPRLLTPHPGEMARLRKADGHKKDDDGKSRLAIAREFTAHRPGVTLLLKGARTLVAQHDLPPAFNTTGNPGMASGGMGDVLTGICAALLGQKLAPFDAARLGAWLHGHAADLAISETQSEQSLAATDLFAYLGAAFRAVRSAA